MKNSLISKCERLLPQIRFIKSDSFYWSPKTKTIYIHDAALDTDVGSWALVHESAHAVLGHVSYNRDIGLLKLEVEAWEKAKEIGEQMGLSVDEEHVQECLNTYRDWLYARSTCPTCSLNGLQVNETTYVCVNCMSRWNVSASRFCRPYRMQDKQTKTPPEKSQTVFA